VSAAGIFLVSDDDAGRPTVGGFLGAVEDLLGHLVTVDGQGQRLTELGVVVIFCLRGDGGGEGQPRILGDVAVLEVCLVDVPGQGCRWQPGRGGEVGGDQVLVGGVLVVVDPPVDGGR